MDSGFFLAPDTAVEKLGVATCNPENPWEPDLFYRGCVECLRAGRFLVAHVTEAGDLRDDGLLEPDGQNRSFTKTSMRELSRTPDFSCFQESIWLTHCDDFMAYIGEWGREEFNQNATDGDGRALFERVDQKASSRGEEWDKLRGYGLYLFRCLRCAKLRSFSDWD